MSDSWLDDPSLYVKPKAGATPNFDDPSLYKVAPKAKSARTPSLIAASVTGVDPLFADAEHGAIGDPIGSAGNPIMSASNAPDPYGPIKPGMWFTGPDGVKRRQDTTLLQDFVGGIERAVTGVGDFFKNAPAAIKAQLAADKLKQANRGMYGAGTGNPFPMPDSDRQAMIADAAPALQAASAELAANQIATEQHLKQFPKSVARQDYEKELHDAKGFGKTLRVMASHPGQFAVGAAEGLGPYVPGMILGAVNPALGAAVGGTTMGTQELEAGIPEYFAKNNIDPTTATPEQIAAAATYANNRASIMATLGALPVGNLARIPEAAAARAGLNPLLHEGINYGLGAAATGGTFGTGEAIANLATDGKIDWARVGQQAGMGIGFHLGSGAKHAVDAAGIRASEGFISPSAARKIAQDPKASQESRLAAAIYLVQNGERIDAPRQSNVIDPAALAAGNEALRNANQGEPQAPPPAAAPERSAVVPEPEASPAPSELDSLMLRNIIEGNHGDAATAPVPDNIPWEAAAAALGLAPPAPAHADPFLDAARLAAQGLRPDGTPIDAKPSEQMASLDVRPKGQEQFNAPEPETAPTPSKASPARVQPSPVENGSNSRILHPGDAEPVDFKVPSQPENIVGGVGHDPVLSALHDMAGGKHPEQALEGADIETVREVAKAMGLKPTAKSRHGAMIERIGEMARADWMKAAKAAIETRGVPKATEPAPVRTRRQAKAEPSAKKPIDLLEAIARSGGLNRDAFRAYGIDPAEFTRRAGFHYVFRKNGGMRPDDLREWMQQEGYLPADHPDRPASVDANDAFDLFDRAFRSGERIYSDDQGDHVARYDEQRRADMAGPDEHDAIDHALAGELGYPDAGAMHDAFANERARQEDRADDIVPEGYNEARSLGELFADPAVRAMSEDEIGRILQLPEADQARALWKAIDERQEATGHFTATDDRGNSRGNGREGAARGGEQASGIREDAEPFTLKQRGSDPQEVTSKPAQSGQLFGEPTARDHVDAAGRAKDAERNGRNGEGRTDMAAGDGELFAGGRPEQFRIEQPAWHGSPHTFDRFSLQHIGSGEGAQAFGWGMYFASNKAIAEHYRKGLSNRDLINKARDAYDEFYSPDEAADALRNIDGLSDAQRHLIDALNKDGWLGFDYPHQAISAALRHPENFDLSPDTEAALKQIGSLHRVEVPEDHDLLDYDRTLSEQPASVRSALQSLSEIKNRSGQNLLELDPTGQEIYRALGDPHTASKTLRDAGIPGLRYLDGNSRRNGEGSHNYVIWDENAIRDHQRVESSRDMFASYPKDGETNGRERQDQTGNGRSDLDSGRASAGGGDAGGVGLRSDATPSLTQRGKYAVESLVRRFGGSVLADKLNRSFRETDTARLIGQKISADPAKAAHDLAAISEVYRNPIFETLRYIFADKDGNILGETAVESRMPSSSAAFPTGEDGVDFIIRNAPDGATHLWLQHNHPSGNPTPSPADVYLTRGLALKLREAGAGIEIAGHVVLNHKTYAFIPHDADPRTFNRDYSVNPIDRPDVNDPLIADRGLSGQRIGNDADAARIGANYLRQIKKDSFVLISTDAKGAVALVSAFPLRALGNPKALGLAAQLGKRSGAYRQFVVIHDTNIPADIRQQVVKALDAGMRSGAIADVVSADGTQHPVIKHSRIVNSGNHIETLLGRNGRGNRAVKVYEEDSGYRRDEGESPHFDPATATSESVTRDGRLLSLIDHAKAKGADLSALTEAVRSRDPDALHDAIDGLLASIRPEPEPQRVTGVKNAVTDAERTAAGRDPILAEAVKGNEATVYEAMRTLKRDPSAGPEAVSRLSRAGVEGISLADEAVLLVHKTDLLNKRDEAAKKLADPSAGEDAKQVAREQWAKAEAEIAAIDIAAKNSGREWGRFGQFRQRMMKEDFTLAALERKERARLERPLTPEESATVKAMADQITALQKRVDELQSRAANSESEWAYEQMTRRVPRGGGNRMDKLRRAADDARRRLQSTPGVASNKGQSGAIISPTAFYDLSVIGAYHVAKGAVKLGDWVRSMRADLGDWFDRVKDEHGNIFSAAKKEAERQAPDKFDASPADVLESIDRDNVTAKDVRKLIAAHVGAGLRGEQAVIGAAAKDLGLPEKDVRALFVQSAARGERSLSEVQQELSDLRKLVRLQNEIDRLEAGEPKPEHGESRPDSPAVAAKKKELSDLRKRLRPSIDPESRYQALRGKQIARRIAELQGRIAAGDFTNKPRVPRELNEANQRAMFALDKAKEDFLRHQFEDNLRKRSPIRKVFGTIGDTFNLARAVMTSFDLSAVLRQGGFIAYGHPLRALKSFGPSLKAFLSDANEHKVNHEIESRPNAPLYKRYGLQLTGIGSGPLTKIEEAYASRWLSKLPWWTGGGIVRGSGRSYAAFINKLRADSFDAMVASLSRSEKPTEAEGKAIANYINVATGRGKAIGGDNAAQALNTVFFAPRLVASRFQLLAGQPLYGGTARTRKMVAMEYARFMMGVGATIGLASIALGAGNNDDDEKPIIGLDPRSADFLKIRVGNTYIDPMAGLSQVTTFLSREITGETVSGKGDVKPLRSSYTLTDLRRALGEDIPAHELGKDGGLPFGSGDAASVFGRFLRTKLAPVPGAIINTIAGSDLIGNPRTIGQTAAELATPMSFQDIGNIMEEHGVAKGTAIELLGLLGMGIQYRQQTNEQQLADLNGKVKAVRADVVDRLSKLPKDQWQQALDDMKQKYGPALEGVELQYYKSDGKYGNAGDPKVDKNGHPVLKSSRISDKAEYRKSAGAENGEQAHHIIPDNLVRHHPLMAQARALGYDLDAPENMLAMPAQAGGDAIAHNTEHPKYDAEVVGALNAAERSLKREYGPLKDAPRDKVMDAIRQVEDKMRERIQSKNVPTKDGQLAAIDRQPRISS